MYYHGMSHTGTFLISARYVHLIVSKYTVINGLSKWFWKISQMGKRNADIVRLVACAACCVTTYGLLIINQNDQPKGYRQISYLVCAVIVYTIV